MTDKKTIGISSLIALGLILASMVTPTFFDNPQYYCESESSIMECPGDLSGGLGTRCYLNIEKANWDYCSSGWAEITDDLVIQEGPVNITEDPIEPGGDGIDGTDGEDGVDGIDGAEGIDGAPGEPGEVIYVPSDTSGLVKYKCDSKECVKIS